MVIGIGGASRSGKSELAKAIGQQLQHLTVKVLSQDEYIKPEADIPKINGIIDWECPESLDFEAFSNAIKQASLKYDIVIAEGLMIYYQDYLQQLFDKKLFVEVNKELFTNRKKHDKRWGATPTWYTDHIWDSYLKFGTINKTTIPDVLVIDGGKDKDLKSIMAFLDIQ